MDQQKKQLFKQCSACKIEFEKEQSNEYCVVCEHQVKDNTEQFKMFMAAYYCRPHPHDN